MCWQDLDTFEPLYTIGGNAKYIVQLLWKTLWRLFKKLKIELAFDPAVSHLHIYPVPVSWPSSFQKFPAGKSVKDRCEWGRLRWQAVPSAPGQSVCF